MENINALSAEKDKLKKRCADELAHNSKLAMERNALKLTVTERENEITKLKQEVRMRDLKINELKHSVASSSAGAPDGKDLNSHTREQSVKIVELKKKIEEMNETLEVDVVLAELNSHVTVGI